MLADPPVQTSQELASAALANPHDEAHWTRGIGDAGWCAFTGRPWDDGSALTFHNPAAQPPVVYGMLHDGAGGPIRQ